MVLAFNNEGLTYRNQLPVFIHNKWIKYLIQDNNYLRKKNPCFKSRKGLNYHENNRKGSVFGTQESYHPRKNFHLKKKWFWVVLETLEKARRETERERPLKRLMGFQRFSPSVFSSPLGLFFLLEVYMDLLQFLIPFLICYVCIPPSHGWWAHHTQAHPL